MIIILATNGVVIACDKKFQSVLVDGSEYQKIQSITPTTGTGKNKIMISI
jgi:20S proteasome alpha/beta subunit